MLVAFCDRCFSPTSLLTTINSFRVTQSLDTKMDIPNLARVFGPTIVGHAVPDPEPMTTIQDTKRQPKVRHITTTQLLF